MMYAFSTPLIGYTLYGAVHSVAFLCLTIGAVFLLFWAFKTLPVKAFWQWGWILIGVGAVLLLLFLLSVSARVNGFAGGAGYRQPYDANDNGYPDGRGGMMRGFTRPRDWSGSTLEDVAPDDAAQ